MNVQLLLLLALAGPFCAFTHASPTELPKKPEYGTNTPAQDIEPEGTESIKLDFTIVTGPPATEPATAPEVVATTEVAATEVVTVTALPTITVNTEEVVVTTEPSATEAPEPVITDSTVVENTETATVEVQPTGADKAETGEDVVVEDPDEGLSSGQVVGIVIGALLAVVIVIAVVIAVVRRMGKYSSAKNKKSAKKDVVVSPLRKKSAKQQERPKFWKF